MKLIIALSVLLALTACSTTQNVSDPTQGKGGLIPDDANSPSD